MVPSNYTTKRKKGQHLTLIERGKIEAYLEKKISKTEIAKLIGVSRRTIQREIKRGMVYGLKRSDLSEYDAYCAESSQRKYEKNQSNKEKSLKIGKNIKLAKYIENSLLNEKNSPYVALENAKKEGIEVNICEKTLYNYIHNNLFIDFSEKDMIYKKKREVSSKRKRNSIRKKGGKSIDERSEVINNREEIGHWEMDTVVGKLGTLGCLLVLTERRSRKQIIRKLENKQSSTVVNAVRGILGEYNGKIKTITSDNGSEFMDAESIEEMGVEYFYSHCYCSWERGSNENNNKLIRRFIPKGVDISTYTAEEIEKIECWMNNYARKLHNGKSANEVYFSEFNKVG